MTPPPQNQPEGLDQAYVVPPLQARSRRTLERLTAGALRLLATVGLDGLTMQGLADETGVSVGAMYGRFAGKEPLLQYLSAHLTAARTERWDVELAQLGQSEPRDLAETVEALVHAVHATLEVDTAVYRQLRQALPATEAEAQRLELAMRGDVRRHLEGCRGAIRHPQPDQALSFATDVIFQLTLGAGPDTPDGDSHSALVTDLVVRYLGGGLPATPEGSVEFFDVWG